MGLLGNATAVKRGVGQSQKEPSQPPKSDPSTPPSCHHSRKFPPRSPGPARQACPTSSPCWDLPLPIPPTPPLSQQLRLDFYFHLLNECSSSFQRELPRTSSTGSCCCWKLGHLCDCVWVREDAKGQCPSNSGLTSSSFILFYKTQITQHRQFEGECS